MSGINLQGKYLTYYDGMDTISLACPTPSVLLPDPPVTPSHLGRCPKNPARTFCPMQPDQRVTLSLETPPSGFHP